MVVLLFDKRDFLLLAGRHIYTHLFVLHIFVDFLFFFRDLTV